MKDELYLKKLKSEYEYLKAEVKYQVTFLKKLEKNLIKDFKINLI